MSDTALHCLAERAGIAVHWRDFRGQPQEVSAQTLRGILTALELPCATPGQIAESRRSLEDEARSAPPPLVTAVSGQPIALSQISSGDALAVTLETGERLDLRPGASDALPPIAQPGYHRLHLGDDEITLAVAPASAYGVEDLAPSRRLWGLSAQLYGLRRSGDGGIGDFSALTELVQRAAAAGAAALAISPVHAWFAADVGRYSPYSPSSRLFLNSLHADPAALAGAPAARAAAYALHLSEELARFEALPLIDWPAAATARLRLQRELYQRHAAASAEELRAFRRERGPALEDPTRGSKRCTPISSPTAGAGTGASGRRHCAIRGAPRSASSRARTATKWIFIFICNGWPSADWLARSRPRARAACALGSSPIWLSAPTAAAATPGAGSRIC